MKTFLKVLLIIVICLILAVTLALGFFGYIPGLSQILGANKPRDLGITYTEADKTSARAKSQVVYETLPAGTSPELSIQRSGTRTVNTSWSSAEMTALMNNRPWRYWPIKDVQLKINDDGTAELSGIVVRDKLSGYAAAIGVPGEVTNTIVKFLPPSPAFYVKAKTSLNNNQVNDFDIQSVYLGKISIPVDTLLSFYPINLTTHALAKDIQEELSKYSGKKAAVVDFINSRLNKITGFNAKKAYFQNGKLYFDGNLSEKEATLK